jgi:hypothetical protein
MKKILVVAIALIASVVSFGQEFMGIKIEGKKDLLITQLKSKGFNLQPKKVSTQTYELMKGNVGGNNFEIMVCYTPITNLVWKLIVTTGTSETWSTLKSNYNKYKEVLIKKYGNPSSDYSFFSSPYDEGDGYEMTGVYAGKCNYASFFDLPNNEGSITLEITKWKEVDISYQNNANNEIRKKEKEQIDSKIF